MTREEAIADIRDNIKPVVGGISLDMAIKALEQEPKWIPVTKRPMTEDEKPWHESCYDEAEILDCPLPEDGEDVLITVNGRTWIDTFIRDDTDGCYFESYDIDEVKAWMPLPKPYDPQERSRANEK